MLEAKGAVLNIISIGSKKTFPRNSPEEFPLRLTARSVSRACAQTNLWHQAWATATGIHLLAEAHARRERVEARAELEVCEEQRRKGVSATTRDWRGGNTTILKNYSHTQSPEDSTSIFQMEESKHVQSQLPV